MPENELRNALHALMETDPRHFRDKEGDRGHADIDMDRVDGCKLDRRGEIQTGKEIGQPREPRRPPEPQQARGLVTGCGRLVAFVLFPG